MSRKRPAPATKRVFAVRLDDETIALIHETAAVDERSAGLVIKRAVRAYRAKLGQRKGGRA